MVSVEPKAQRSSAAFLEPHWNPEMTKENGGISTDRGVQTAKPYPDGTRAEYVIKGSPGLRLRVSEGDPMPEKVWSLLYRRKADGKRIRIALGEYPTLSLKQAKDEAGRLRSQAKTGTDPAAERQRDSNVFTVAALVDKYIEQHAKPRKRSWRNDRYIADADILPAIGKLPVANVVKRDIIRIRDTVFERGASYQSNRVVALSNKLFRFAVAEDLLAANPAAGVQKRGIEKQRKRPMTDSEIRVFWNGLDQSKMTEPLQVAMKIALLLGCRINEIAEAYKQEFDLSAKVWTIPGTRHLPHKTEDGGTKNRRDFSLPLPPMAVALIERALELSGKSRFLFPSPYDASRPIGETAISRGWNRSRKTMGSLSNVRVHDLRHTISTGLGNLGFPRFEIDLITNHVRPEDKVGAGYVHAQYLPEKLKLLEAWENRLKEILAA
jgi:integrase